MKQLHSYSDELSWGHCKIIGERGIAAATSPSILPAVIELLLALKIVITSAWLVTWRICTTFPTNRQWRKIVWRLILGTSSLKNFWLISSLQNCRLAIVLIIIILPRNKTWDLISEFCSFLSLEGKIHSRSCEEMSDLIPNDVETFSAPDLLLVAFWASSGWRNWALNWS